MLVYREVLRLHFELDKSFATIGEICGISKGGVHNILQRFAASGVSWPLLEEVDEVMLKRLLYPTTARETTEGLDLEYLRTEALRPGMTWQLLWEEYRETHPAGISRSAFYRLVQQMERTKPVMRTDYPGGEYLFVDYSGQRLAFWDRAADTQVPVEIFVASWGASSQTYVGGSLTQSARDFVASHVDAFAFFEEKGTEPYYSSSTIRDNTFFGRPLGLICNGRPMRVERRSIKSDPPQAFPLTVAVRSARISSPSSPDSQSLHPAAVSRYSIVIGDRTGSVLRPQCAAALDQGYSSARSTCLARSGFRSTSRMACQQ